MVVDVMAAGRFIFVLRRDSQAAGATSDHAGIKWVAQDFVDGAEGERGAACSLLLRRQKPPLVTCLDRNLLRGVCAREHQLEHGSHKREMYRVFDDRLCV